MLRIWHTKGNKVPLSTTGRSRGRGYRTRRSLLCWLHLWAQCWCYSVTVWYPADSKITELLLIAQFLSVWKPS